MSENECKYKHAEHHNQHVIIEASAGTGKTFTIENIIPQFIQENIPIESIAVLTFTEKAAAELQDRIRKSILNYINDKSHGKLELYETALEHLPNASIGTIHQFCRTILKKYSFELGISSQFIEIKDAETEIGNYFKRFWGKIEKDDSKELIELLQKIDYANFKEILIQFASSTSGQPISNLVDRFNEAECKKDFVTIKEIVSIIRSNNNKKPPQYITKLKEIDTELNSSFKPEQLEIIISTLLTKDYSPRKNERDYLLKENNISDLEYDNLLIKILDHWTKYKQKDYLPVLNQIISLANQFIADYRSYLLKKDAIHLDELIFETRRLLIEFPKIQKQLQKTYQYLILDECQDTNPIQMDLILELFKNAKTGIILVGDPKQSIYRFRNADLISYRHAVESLKSKHEITLDISFRSSYKLIEAFNQIFPHFKSLHEIYKKVESDRALDEVSSSIKPPLILLGLNQDNQPKTDTELGEKYSAEIIREESTQDIIKIIKTITDNSDYLILDKETKQYRKILYSDIAILANSHSQLSNILTEFSKNSISANIYKNQLFYSHRIVQAISHLLHAIENPNDSASLYKTLASDLFLVPEKTLFYLSEARELNYLNVCSNSEIEEIYKSLRKAHESRYTKDISFTLHNLLSENRIFEFLSMGFEGKRNLANIYHLLEILSYSQLTENLSFGEIVRNLKKDVVNSTEQEIKLDNDKKDSDFNSVQLMTFHASKGLEFPVCILYNLTGVPRNEGSNSIYIRDKKLKTSPVSIEFAIKDKEDTLLESPEFKQLKEENYNELQSEKDRLLYVAFTRARDYLVLPLHNLSNADKKSNLSKLINAFSDSQITYLIQNKLAENFNYPQRDTKDKINSEKNKSLKSVEEKSIRKIDLSQNEIYNHSGIKIQSYSSLAKQLETEEEEPVKERVATEKKSLLETDESSPIAISAEKRGTTFGLLCHAVMENFDLDLLTDLNKTRNAVTDMVNEYYPPTGLMEIKDYTSSEAIEYCFATLTKQYPMNAEQTEFSYIKDWKHLKRERSFYYKLKTSKMDYLIGIGDGLFLWNNKYYILDWKTNLIHLENKPLNETLFDKVEESYKIQYMIYCMNLLDNISYKSSDPKKFWEDNFGGMIFIFMRITADKEGSVLIKPSFDEIIKFKKDLEKS